MRKRRVLLTVVFGFAGLAFISPIHAQVQWETLKGPYLLPVYEVGYHNGVLFVGTRGDDQIEPVEFYSSSLGVSWDTRYERNPNLTAMIFDDDGFRYNAEFSDWDADVYIHKYYPHDYSGQDFVKIPEGWRANRMRWQGSVFLLIATETGLFRVDKRSLSTSLNRVAFQDTVVSDIAVDDSLSIWASTEHGLYNSLDGGESWRRKLEADSLTSVLSGALSPGQKVASSYVGTISCSADGGETWTVAEVPTDDPVTRLEADGDYLLAGTSNGVIVSKDGGCTWLRSGVDQHVSRLLVAEGRWFAGTVRGLFRSDNKGLSWQKVGFPGLFAGSLLFEPLTGRLLLSDWESGIVYSDDKGISWNDTNIQYGFRAGFTNLYNGTLQADEYLGFRRLISEDNGATWIDIEPEVEIFSVYPDRSVMLGSRNRETVRSFDQGANWEVLPSTGITAEYWVLGLAPDKTIWAEDRNESVYVLPDGADEWKLTNFECKGMGCYIETLAFGKRGDMCIAYSRKVWCSRDHGETWTESEDRPEYDGYLRMVIADDGTVYQNGYPPYRLIDGTRWEAYGEGLKRYPVFEPGIIQIAMGTDGVLYGTSSYGFSRTTQPVSTGVEQTGAPDDTGHVGELSVYPNPYTGGKLTVSFLLQQPGPVSVFVYDVTGRRVAEPLVDLWFSIGGHSHDLGLQNLPNGFYTVTVTSGKELWSVPVVKTF